MNYDKNLLSLIANIDTQKLLELNDFISGTIESRKIDIALARRSEKILESPCHKCGFTCLMKWGKVSSGSQRFRCRYCKTTISITTNTSVHRLRYRRKWPEFMRLMSTHISVYKLKEDHFVGMSKNTMLRWRHRFLSAFEANDTGKMSGVVQVDEKFFRQSFKGDTKAVAQAGRSARKRGGSNFRGISREQVAVLTALDSNGVINQEMIGRLNYKNVVETMKPWLSPENVIVSDGYKAYERVAENFGCDHIVSRTKNGHHPKIARLNAYHTFIENLINRKCLGVSTNHLMKYLAWATHSTMQRPFGDGMLAEVLSR